MSVTTKHLSKTMETNALSFSSSTGITLTSVISMLFSPSPVRPQLLRRFGSFSDMDQIRR
jgi:hypothetical protein